MYPLATRFPRCPIEVDQQRCKQAIKVLPASRGVTRMRQSDPSEFCDRSRLLRIEQLILSDFQREGSMAIRDVLLALTSYPEPTPVSVVENAVSFASSLGCHIAALACEVHVQVPGSFLSSSLVNVAGMAASEANKSRKAAEALLAAFDSIADKSGLSHERIIGKMFDARSTGYVRGIWAASRLDDSAGPGSL